MSIFIVDLLDGSDIDLPVPPPLVQATDRPAVDRWIEDCRYHLELLGTVVLAAGIDAHLPHGQALGVSAVLLSRHPARLVGTLPDDDIAVRPALYRPAANALRLHPRDQIDATLTQLAGEEV